MVGPDNERRGISVCIRPDVCVRDGPWRAGPVIPRLPGRRFTRQLIPRASSGNVGYNFLAIITEVDAEWRGVALASSRRDFEHHIFDETSRTTEEPANRRARTSLPEPAERRLFALAPSPKGWQDWIKNFSKL